MVFEANRGCVPVTPPDDGNLYSRIIQIATIPVLLAVVALSIVIIQFLMSTKWQQARRNKQIRKAVAQRKKDAELQAADEAEIRSKSQ